MAKKTPLNEAAIKIRIQRILQYAKLNGDDRDALNAALDIIDDYPRQARVISALVTKYESADPPVMASGVYLCPACRRRITEKHDHCHRCGKKVSWKIIPRKERPA